VIAASIRRDEGDGGRQRHIAAMVPIEVPVTNRVKGIIATTRMMKGVERSITTASTIC
jgi:hypothetical protein